MFYIKQELPVNGQIRAKEVQLIGDKGEKLGVVSLREALEKAEEKNLDLVLSIFKLRLLSILGFRPNVNECVNCKGKEDLIYFSLRDNGVKCKNCGKQDKSSITISESTYNAIKYTITAPPKKLFSFSIKDESLEEFKLVTKLYFNEKLEKEYKI